MPEEKKKAISTRSVSTVAKKPEKATVDKKSLKRTLTETPCQTRSTAQKAPEPALKKAAT